MRSRTYDGLAAEGDPRVEKIYSEKMRLTDPPIDTPGLPDIYTFQNLCDELE